MTRSFIITTVHRGSNVVKRDQTRAASLIYFVLDFVYDTIANTFMLTAESKRDIVYDASSLMVEVAGGNKVRQEMATHWFMHGLREAMVLVKYFEANPEDLPVNIDLDDLLFGVIIHDIGKIPSNDPQRWLYGSLTPEERKQHIPLGIQALH